jgi:L-glyceraldehyde 3-phosphate reductase
MALAWVLKDRRITSVLIGASSPAQIENSVRALSSSLFSVEELVEIDRHAIDAGVNLWARSRQA